MRNKDIETLSKIADILPKCSQFINEKLLNEFMDTFMHLNNQNQKEKQNYKKKADYHIAYKKEWQKNNKDKKQEYQKRYKGKKIKNI